MRDHPAIAALAHNPVTNATLAVHADRLAMIARQPSERAVESASGLKQRTFAAGIAPAASQIALRHVRAEPVVDQAHAHPARARASASALRSARADLVVADDVILEEDLVACVADRLAARRDSSPWRP